MKPLHLYFVLDKLQISFICDKQLDQNCNEQSMLEQWVDQVGGSINDNDKNFCNHISLEPKWTFRFVGFDSFKYFFGRINCLNKN